VGFRLLLALPHLVWLALWGIAVLVAVVVAWFVALVIGRVPLLIHRFVAAYVRYSTHVSAYLLIIAGPFPGFVGAPGRYPVDLEIDAPVRQRRLVTLFRALLAFPAMLLAYAFVYVELVIGLYIWVYSLVLGRAPDGLRDLGTALVRYRAQLNAYLFLLTPTYPNSSPALGGPALVVEPSATFEPIPPPPPPAFEPPAPLPQTP
jgi:hypothetical protein